MIDRFIDMGILMKRDPNKTYARTYEYCRYLEIFEDSSNQNSKFGL